MKIEQIPIIRGGLDKEYFTSEKYEIFDYKNEKIAEVSQTPSLLVYIDALPNSKKSKLRRLNAEETLKIIEKAADRFADYSKDYEEYVCRATGLPISEVKGAYKAIYKGMKDIRKIINAQVGNIKNLDLKGENKVVYLPRGGNLSFILPSNHPAVQILWITSLALKYPSLLRPSNNEPFTTYALVKSLYEAGMPEYSQYLLPGGYDVANELVEQSDLSVVFGSENLVNKYKGNRNIKVYGPGNSKIYVDRPFIDEEKVLDVIETSMMDFGGRGCINASQVVVEGKYEDAVTIGEKLVERLKEIKIYDPMDERARIPAIDKETGESLNEYIEKFPNDEDIIIPEANKRLVKYGDALYMKPTVAIINDRNSPLNIELPFQYITVIPTNGEDYLDHIRNSLTVSLFTEDGEKIVRAILDPSINKVYTGLPTNYIEFTHPHEGYLADFLLEKKSVIKMLSL